MASLLAATEPLSTALQSVSITENFLTTLNKYRNEINYKFKRISDNLIIRQKQLIAELDEIEKRYMESQNNNNIEISIQQLQIVINEQKIMLRSTFNTFSGDAQSNMRDIIKHLDIQIYNLREKMEIYANTECALYTTNINTIIKTLGTVTLKHDWDYSQYTPRVICNNNKYLNIPRGVDIGVNIYVVNCGSNSISVFAFTGEYLREFGKDVLKDPWGIVVHNNSLYIACSTALYKYTFAGEMMNSVTYYGACKKQFYNAKGVNVNNKGLLFVCDRDNNCIPVFDENLSHQRTLRHESIKQPRDINTKHEQVYILTSSEIHVLSENGTYLKQIDNRCLNALFFTLDNYSNIIISDYNNHIIILSLYNDHNIKHRLGNSSYSTGIALTNNNIINVCSTPLSNSNVILKSKLQIYSF